MRTPIRDDVTAHRIAHVWAGHHPEHPLTVTAGWVARVLADRELDGTPAGEGDCGGCVRLTGPHAEDDR